MTIEPPAASACPFCKLPNNKKQDSNAHGWAVRDMFPVSPGHTLVVPHRHVASFFDLTTPERDGLMALVERAKAVLDEELHPDGYNIGINDGAVAGQTVPHVHIHLIPRFSGDVPDPRGGVRWVLPDKAKYWA
jgi:diadenosine tetraphosphate (Ap4A) HIT family hydrolase